MLPSVLRVIKARPMVREAQPGINITGQSDRRSPRSMETSRSNDPSYPQTWALVNTRRNQ